MALLVMLIWPTMALPSMAASFAQDDSKWIEVEAEGRGATAKEARKAAMLAALRKIAGEFLVQNTVMENDQITDDELLTFTTQKAFESEDLEGFPTIEGDGTWYVKMKIRVIARDFKQMIDRFRPTTVTGKQTVEAEGIGKSAVEAERNAIANGIRQIIGEHIDSEIVINDERVVKDLIKSYTTSKNVTSERIGNFRVVGDEVAVTMRVTAELEPLYAMFRERSTSATVIDGDVLAAELDLARDNIVAQRKILENLLLDLPTRLLIARLVDRDGKPILDGRPTKKDMRPIVGSDQIAIAVNIECYFDLETFYTKVAPALSRALHAMSESHKENVYRVSKEDDPNQPSRTLFTDEPTVPLDFSVMPWKAEFSPDLFEVVLARTRNEDGSLVVFDRFLLSTELLLGFTNVCQLQAQKDWTDSGKWSRLDIAVSVDFLDADGLLIQSQTQFASSTFWQPSQRTNTWGIDLPIDIGSRSSRESFNLLSRLSGGDKYRLIILPGFTRFLNLGILDNPSWFSDTTVSRFELRMNESDLERLDRIELHGQLVEIGYRRHGSSGIKNIVNPDIESRALGWKDAQGNPIEPGGAFGRSNRSSRTRANRGSSSSASGQAPTTNQESPRQAELKQFDGLVYKLGNYAMNGICDKARSTADELLSMDQELMNEDKLWLGITKTGRCPRAQKELLEKLIELYPDRPRTNTAKKMLKKL
ncbi:MAG: hypothetical protein P8J86_03365 [Phycisphaerales bacterium]|nr:hypothetical protein [Phycisphaerales bacterium]